MSTETQTTDPILWMQQQVREHLLKADYFGSLADSILLADRGTILETLDVEVAKLGLAIIIEPTQVSFEYFGSNIAIVFDDAHPITITVWENVSTNRSTAGTRRRASEVAVQIAKQFRPGQSPEPPCTFTKAVLAADSGGRCVYTLNGVGRSTLL